MTTQISHNGGLADVVLELGFDTVKYFEGVITSTASGFNISPPARRVIVNNRNENGDVYLRINDGTATTDVAFIPGNNIKISPGCSFSMDFDSIKEISLVTAGESVQVEGILGWKGSVNC